MRSAETNRIAIHGPRLPLVDGGGAEAHNVFSKGARVPRALAEVRSSLRERFLDCLDLMRVHAFSTDSSCRAVVGQTGLWCGK